MIIRKPFAFIIQKFKLLHFLVLVPVLYLVVKFYHLKNFFNKFVVDGYLTDITNAPEVYYSFLMLFACIIIIAFCVLLIALFKRKNKYYFPYLLVGLFYLGVFVFSLFTKGLLVNAVNSELASSTSLIIRSLTMILFYGQVVCIPIILLLTFGFDIRSGEFIDIKEEISFDEEDSEEVEINLASDNYKVKRWFNRYIREIKYYFIENKNIFIVLGSILGIIILFFIGKFLLSLNRVIRVDQSFNYSKISLTITGSTLSTLDYGGNVISDGKIYLAVKVNAKNNTTDLLPIVTSDFCLEVDGQCVYPTLDRSGKFIDLGLPYYGEKIGKDRSYDYVFVYELAEEQAQNKYKVKVLDSLVYKKDEVIPKYKEITLTPSYISNVNKVGDYSIGSEIKFNQSNLLNTTFKVTNAVISDFYRYNYNYCYKDNCYDSVNSVTAASNNMLLVLDGELNEDVSSAFFRSVGNKASFYDNFCTIKYTLNGKEYVAEVKDKTPKEVSGKVVLETTGSIRNADSIQLIITIRDKAYYLNVYKKG